MIAEIFGKLSSTGSNLSERLEDQLTGNVFGTLRYIDNQYGIFSILMDSYFLSKHTNRKHLNFCNPTIKSFHFWPWVVEAEPDILLEVAEKDSESTIVQIEVKYFSGLSSDDDVLVDSLDQELSDCTVINTDKNDNQEIKESPNQLIRQMRSLKKIYPEHRRIQIYLTTDVIYPNAILSRVRSQANAEGLKDIELYWLSWHDIPTVLEKNREHFYERENIVIDDLLRLFERKGFARFSKIQIPTDSVPDYFRLSAYNHLFGQTQASVPQPISSLHTVLPPNISIPKLNIYKETENGK